MRRDGDAIGALALVVHRQPDVPGTGHRICNDCMKACIYQKQEPVNIPQIETGVLTDVLALPWGVEIYGLLTRWNPLNVARPVRAARTTARTSSSSASGRPATRWRTTSLNEGFGVVGDRRPQDRAAAGGARRRRRRAAARRSSDCERDLPRSSTSACCSGFGGVSEYGITVRWDKNFLTLALPDAGAARRRSAIYGGVRFGGTLDARGRVGARLRPRRDRGRRRAADDHRHEEQPDPRHPQGVATS